MRKIVTFLFFGFMAMIAKAQTPSVDTVVMGKVKIIKDNRLNELAKKEAAFNEVLALRPRSGKGYRLMVLSTNDRQLAMKVRGMLLQRYPDQKAYTIFQAPNIKLKFGNYVEKGDAQDMRDEILRNKIVTGNIYIVPDNIEIKPDKNKEANGEK